MKTKDVIISAMLATLVCAVTFEAGTVEARVRARNAAKAAALSTTPEERQDNQENRQDNRQENVENRQERWNNASPNQKAVTYNVARTRHAQKQAVGAAAVSRRR
jgi:hypothetical protein